jgi:hypothetical protein
MNLSGGGRALEDLRVFSTARRLASLLDCSKTCESSRLLEDQRVFSNSLALAQRKLKIFSNSLSFVTPEPPADEDWQGIASLHHDHRSAFPTLSWSQGSGGCDWKELEKIFDLPWIFDFRGSPRRGGVGRRMYRCATKRGRNALPSLVLYSGKGRAGKFWDDLFMSDITERKKEDEIDIQAFFPARCRSFSS